VGLPAPELPGSCVKDKGVGFGALGPNKKKGSGPDRVPGGRKIGKCVNIIRRPSQGLKMKEKKNGDVPVRGGKGREGRET